VRQQSIASTANYPHMKWIDPEPFWELCRK